MPGPAVLVVPLAGFALRQAARQGAIFAAETALEFAFGKVFGGGDDNAARAAELKRIQKLYDDIDQLKIEAVEGGNSITDSLSDLEVTETIISRSFDAFAEDMERARDKIAERVKWGAEVWRNTVGDYG